MLDTEKMKVCRHLLPEPGPEVVEGLINEIEKLRDALQWCGGSADFGYEGKAHAGWVKICKPLLEK